jgi:uncharacterized caspase-like protein
VVGNGAYQHAAPLPNPSNDAADLAMALRELGFEVIEARDVNRATLGQKVGEFSRKASGAKTALLFYAGHGIQVDGRNYLVPVDAKLEHPTDLEFQAVDATRLIEQMQNEDRVNLVFLDACRDNPLARTLARSMGGTRSAAVGQGLAKIDAGRGTLIAFATSPSNVALDGSGRNSPFTTALLKHIKTPGLDIHRVLTRVTADVEDLTNGSQSPWVHASLRREVILNPGQETTMSVPGPAANAPAARDACGDSAAHFRAAESFGSADALEDHVQRFPNCAFSGLARAKLAALKADETARLRQEQERNSAAGLGAECDRLAASPTDGRKPANVAGVAQARLQPQAAAAIAACEKAVELNPAEPRYLYQLARAQQVTDAKKAFAMYRRLEAVGYPAAFDNLGALYANGRGGERSSAKALAAFKRGMELGDPAAAASFAKASAPKPTGPQTAQQDGEPPAPTTRRTASPGAPTDADIARQMRDEDARRKSNEESTKTFMNILGTGIGSIPRR